MNRGILFIVLSALPWSFVGQACRTAATPEQMKDVDGMLTRAEAALLTLGELDRGRYDRAAALYRSDAPRFMERFRDTLDRNTAERLGGHFLVLRAAEDMGKGHDQVVDELTSVRSRLRALRNDLMNGSMGGREASTAIRDEARAVDALDAPVQTVIANYRAVQRAWDSLASVDSLLAAGPRKTALR